MRSPNFCLSRKAQLWKKCIACNSLMSVLWSATFLTCHSFLGKSESQMSMLRKAAAPDTSGPLCSTWLCCSSVKNPVVSHTSSSESPMHAATLKATFKASRDQAHRMRHCPMLKTCCFRSSSLAFCITSSTVGRDQEVRGSLLKGKFSDIHAAGQDRRGCGHTGSTLWRGTAKTQRLLC